MLAIGRGLVGPRDFTARNNVRIFTSEITNLFVVPSRKILVRVIKGVNSFVGVTSLLLRHP